MFYALDAGKIMISERKYNDLNWVSHSVIENYINKQIGNSTKNTVLMNLIWLFYFITGTTGKPKKHLTHKNLWANIEGLYFAWHWSEEDILLCCLCSMFMDCFSMLWILRAQATLVWNGNSM